MFVSFGKTRNEYGISAVVRQTVTLRETSKINDRVFNHSKYILYWMYNPHTSTFL